MGVAFTKSKGKGQLNAVITRADGRQYNLGRIDNKHWAPRAWWYRFVIFPIDKRKLRYNNNKKG